MAEGNLSRFTAAEGGARLASAARRRNTIACELSSFVATRLLHEGGHMIRGPFSSGKHRSVFVTRASRVPCVAYELRILTDLAVCSAVACGDVEDWSQEIEEKEVLVCTSAVFRQLLDDSTLSMTRINILVVDSCHLVHTDKDLQIIMDVYKASPQKPRVLGLTYPLFSRKPDAQDTDTCAKSFAEECSEDFGISENVDDFEMYGKLEWNIEQLEQRLCCQMDLAEDIDGGKRFTSTVTKPKELIVEYSARRSVCQDYEELESFMRTTVREVTDFLDEHRYDPTEIYGEDLYEEFMNIPNPTIDPKLIFKQFLYVLDELGPYGADKAAFSLLTKLEKLKIKVPYERHFLLLCLCTTVLVKIRCYTDLVFSKYSDLDRITTFSTPKVLRFIDILTQFENTDDEKHDANEKGITATENDTQAENTEIDGNRVINVTTECVQDDKNQTSDKLDDKDNDDKTRVESENLKNGYKVNVNDTSDDKENKQNDKITKMLADIDKCDFVTLSNKLEDQVNTYEANLKEIHEEKTEDEKIEKTKMNSNTEADSPKLDPKPPGFDPTDPRSILGFPRRARVRGRGRVQRNVTRNQLAQQNPDALCGIVFMNEPIMAKIMFLLVVDLSRSSPRLSHISAQYCSPAGTSDAAELRRHCRAREDALKKFRMHDCNLLLATSALEEGIDLPRCNLVLRWDVPTSYRSHGLCRGRARAPRATCALLVRAGDRAPDTLLRHVAVYKELDQIISRKCGCGIQDEPPQQEEDQADTLTALVIPYSPSIAKVDEKHVRNLDDKNDTDDIVKDDESNKAICDITDDISDENDNTNIEGKDKFKTIEIEKGKTVLVETIEAENKLVDENEIIRNDAIDDDLKDNNESNKAKEVIDSGINLSCDNKDRTSEVCKCGKRTSVDKECCVQCKSEKEAKKDDVASVDLSNAIALINRYCGKLPSDTFTRLAPSWRTERVRVPAAGGSAEAWVCTLRLPLNCPVKCNQVGHPMPTRVLARRAAALQACRVLHKAGELDDHLMPIGKENFKAGDLEGACAEGAGDARPGTTKRRQYYYKRTARAFTNCEPIVDTTDKQLAAEVDGLAEKTTSTNVLYAVCCTLWCGLPERYNTRGRRLHAPQLARQAVGVLLRDHRSRLQIPSFPVYTRSGEVRVTVAPAMDADTRLSPRRATLVLRFMRFVFADVLRVRRRGMTLQSEGSTHNNYYVVPTLKVNNPDGSTKIDIDWKFLEEIYQYTEDKANSELEKPMLWPDEDEEAKKEEGDAKRDEAGGKCEEGIEGKREGGTEERNEVNEGKQNEATGGNRDKATREKNNEALEGKWDEAFEKKRDEAIKEKPNEVNEGKQNEATEGNQNESTKEKRDEATVEKHNESMEEKRNEATKGKQDEGTKEKRNEAIEGTPNKATEGKQDEATEKWGETTERKWDEATVEMQEEETVGDVKAKAAEGKAETKENEEASKEKCSKDKLEVSNKQNEGARVKNEGTSKSEKVASDVKRPGGSEASLNGEAKTDGERRVKKMENPLLKPGEVFVFDPEKYREAVVTPWYRNRDQPQFFLVAEICWNLTPDSEFPSDTHTSFREYYKSKYGVTLTQPNQPLLDVDHTSARLNLLTPRYVNRKGVALPVSSERTRRAKRDRLDQKQILVPELCAVHPFAAPLWFATVALPCVLYRINALLIADEIRRAVAADVGLGVARLSATSGFQWPPLDFGWSLAEVLNADSEKNDKKKEGEEGKEDEDTELREEELKESKEESSEPREKTINDILQEKEDAESGFEIGTWDNDMASSIPEQYDEFMEPLPPNLTFCTSASGGANWCDPVQKPKNQFKPSRTFSMADSDCSYMSSDFDTDDSDLNSEDSDETETSGFCSSKSNAAMGVRIEYKTAHEAEAVDLERQLPNPAPQPDDADDAADREQHARLVRAGDLPTECLEKFNKSVAEHEKEIIENGLFITEDQPITDILPDTLKDCRKPEPIPEDQIKTKFKELFPYKNEYLNIEKGCITLEDIEKNKRYLLNEFKKTLTEEEIKKYTCFSMIDVDIDSPEYKNEKISNIGFDDKEAYKEKVESIGSREFAPYYEDNKGQNGKEFDFDFQPNLEGHPGPSPSVILQALTMSNANDGINLERLETIGDSFLKFAITAYLYCAHPTVHEGKLSHMRSKQVSNLNLYRLGLRKRLGARMIASKFEPHDNWLPPAHRAPPAAHAPVDSEDANPEAPLAAGCFIPYNLITQHSIPDKSIADCVEALIGAYLLECGPRGALLFMSWLGIRVLPRHELPVTQGDVIQRLERHKKKQAARKPRRSSSSSDTSDSDDDAPPRPVGSLAPYQDEKGQWLLPMFGALKAPPSPLLRYISDPEGELERMLSGYDALERTLQYRFRDRSLLLQAMTHASHQRNRLTDCYQRLEFLGDAILDYLITRHLYEDPRRHSPGALTDLRSALVNNTIFATLAARHGFHRYFRHMSPGLNEVLARYVRIQEENGHSISEEHYLIHEDELEQAEDVEVPKALGDLFESVAGAIFLDSGMSLAAVWRSYEQLMGAELEAFSAAAPKSPVRELLEAEPDTAKFGKPERLADGRRVRVCVEVFGRGAFKGVGRNYRIAKGTAARCALRHLKRHKPH